MRFVAQIAFLMESETKQGHGYEREGEERIHEEEATQLLQGIL